MVRFLHKILLLLFILALLSLVASYLSVYVSPNTMWVLSFFGLAFPIILVINLVFLLYWIIRQRRKLYIISTIVLLIGVTHITDFVQFFNFSSDKSEETNSFKVLTYNVRLFDLYSWDSKFKNRNAILDLIRNEHADIVCLQEFYYDVTGRFSILDSLRKIPNTKEYFVSDSHFKVRKYHFGMIIISKYPILNKDVITYDQTDNFTSFVDVLINKDTVRVYSNHLQSIKFGHSDYENIDSLKLGINKEEIKYAKNITKLLKKAFQKRAIQAEVLSKHISSSPYKTIVVGDFNDTPISYAYHTIINAGLEDAFCESGSMISNTYVGKFPSFRIDYILHTDNLESFNYKRITKEYSDHYPISCEFIINTK